MKKIKLAIFASGSGSNAKNIINYFYNHPTIEVSFILSNKSDAPIVSWSKENNLKVIVLSNEEVNNGELLIQHCIENDIHTIVLAGYLRKIPADFIRHYNEKIINIHPSLLPKFGGKGMYGDHVHKAVIDSKEKESGVTIHLVNEEYDKGKILAQFSVPIETYETVDSLREKIKKLEHIHLPEVLQNVINR